MDTKYTPTAGEQQMLGDFNNRMADINRVAQSAGAAVLSDPNQQQPAADPYAGMSRSEVAQYTNDPAALNRAATADSALRDARSTGLRGVSTGFQGYDGAATALGQIPTSILPANDPRRHVTAFADGGKPESAEELMARISAKYKVSSTPQESMAPATQPKPQTQPAPARQPGGLLQQAIGGLNNRNRELEQAIKGYAAGGQMSDAQLAERSVSAVDRRRLIQHRQKQNAEIDQNVARLGGKIKGPGTPTSDSIPAKVPETGEDILVSTQERILSKAQDDLLLRIANALGFSTVDALLESGTGKPVGPTIKGGKQAAACGGKPKYANGSSNPDQEDGPAPGVKYAAGVTPNQVGPLTMMAQAYGGQINKLLGPDTDARLAANRAGLDSTQETQAAIKAERHPVSVPASRPGALLLGEQPGAAPNAQVLTTKDIVPGGYTDRGAGIVGSRSKNGQLNVTNVGTEGIADRNTPIVDGSASALLDQKNSTYNPARQLENMQRLRLTSDATDPTITDPNVRAQAIQGLAILNAGRAGADASALTQENISQARTGSEMRGKLLDPNTPPEERSRMIQTLQAINGKADRPTNLQVHDLEVPLDEKRPLLGMRKQPHSFNPMTGEFKPLQSQQQASDPMSQAKAAIARGADRAAVNARLKAMGFPEVK